MQPRTIALLVTLLPPIAANLAYIMSAYNGSVPWCIPYIDGCTTVSRAARNADAIFVFRALMMFYAVLLIWYWWIVKHWLHQLNQQASRVPDVIYWLGVIGALFLVVYIDFLGSSGEIYRFMRRYGVIVYFSFTPLAHLLMLNHLKKLRQKRENVPVSQGILRYQLTVILLIVALGLYHVVVIYSELRSYQTQNIIEWNYALLMALFFASSYFMWKGLKLELNKLSEES